MSHDTLRRVDLHESHEEWRLSLEEHHDQEFGEIYVAELSHRDEQIHVVAKIARVAFEQYVKAAQSLQPELRKVAIEDVIASDILAELGESVVPRVITITGRSGSGKSTIVKEVAARLSAESVSTVVLSSDDYNHGKAVLGEGNTNWDASYVYDTALLADHIEKLLAGENIPCFSFDFKKGERTIKPDLVRPARVILVEGILANSPHLSRFASRSYTLSTPVATCIGRRVKRDIEEGRAGAVGSTHEEVLRYQLEVAELEYLARLQAV